MFLALICCRLFRYGSMDRALTFASAGLLVSLSVRVSVSVGGDYVDGDSIRIYRLLASLSDLHPLFGASL